MRLAILLAMTIEIKSLKSDNQIALEIARLAAETRYLAMKSIMRSELAIARSSRCAAPVFTLTSTL